MKKCIKCLQIKELSEFTPKKVGGHTSACKPCRNHELREKYKNPEVKRKTRNRQLKNDFGISLAEYETKLAAQKFSCATCGRDQSIIGKTLAVDHNHQTGAVRDLLCDYCNRLLGSYEKSPGLFAAFDTYLNKHRSLK